MISRVALPLVVMLVVAACAAPAGAQQSSPRRVREFAALPNWSGLWETEVSAALASGDFERSFAASKSTDADSSLSQPGAVTAFEREFFRRTQLLGKPPYNAEWEQKYQSDVARLKDPAVHAAAEQPPVRACAIGYPLIMESPTDGFFEALVTPEQTLLLFADGEVRHIYTDGRPHPKREDLWPTDIGDSIGRWDGMTLVIDTIERKAGPLIPLPQFLTANLSEQAHFTERLRMVDANTLLNDLTIEDPQRLAHPWTVSIRYKRVTDVDRMIATNCTENDRNPTVNGKVTISAP